MRLPRPTPDPTNDRADSDKCIMLYVSGTSAFTVHSLSGTWQHNSLSAPGVWPPAMTSTPCQWIRRGLQFTATFLHIKPEAACCASGFLFIAGLDVVEAFGLYLSARRHRTGGRP
jgi:hypothetical protein